MMMALSEPSRLMMLFAIIRGIIIQDLINSGAKVGRKMDKSKKIIINLESNPKIL